MTVDPDMRALIDRCAELRPEVLAEAIAVPHHNPNYFIDILASEESRSPWPFCGCFVGNLALVFDLHDGDWSERIDLAEYYVNRKLDMVGMVGGDAGAAGMWCDTRERNRAAVRYARQVLRAKAAA